MPDAQRPSQDSPIRFATEKLLRSLIYYAALLSCVVIAIAVSFTVILQLARNSVEDHITDPNAVREARALSEYARELREITTLLKEVAKKGDSPPTEAFSRRLNDVRRRMRKLPHDSNALNSLMQAGDRLVAWAATPGDSRARDRADEAVNHAETAVDQRVKALNVPDLR